MEAMFPEHIKTAMARPVMEAESGSPFCSLLTRVDREELLSLLENLRTDEEDHRVRLLALLHGAKADRPAEVRRPAGNPSIRRMTPGADLH